MFHHASALCCLELEPLFALLRANIYYLDKFQNFIVAVQWCLAPCSIRRTHEYDISLESKESNSLWATSAQCRRLPLHIILLSQFATQMYQAAEQETVAD